MSKLARKVVYGEELQTKISKGIEQIYQVAEAAYGPKAGNVLIEQPYGDPLVSRDGVTNVDRVFLADPIENQAAAIIKQASRKSNKKVGDGTTAVVILSYYLYSEARKLISGGHNQMEVARQLKATAADVMRQIDDMKKPVTDELLRHVANISAGDPAIGEMIADVIHEVGIDGGVTIEDFAGVGIYNEIVDGFYFRRGFTNINLTKDPSNLESRHENVPILISEKRLTTSTDVAPILDKIVGKGIRELVIVADVGEEALGVLLLNRLKGIITTTVVDSPVFGAMRSLFLEDLAIVTGGKVYLSGANPQDFDTDMLGAAGKVIVNEFSTTVLNGDGGGQEVEERVRDLRAQLAEASSEITIDALKGRLSRLTGKIAIVRVGGATETEQGETKLRVQDAICAVQAAIKDGIVPGGGIALARCEPLEFEDAFQQLFKTLVNNAGLNAEEALWKALRKPTWYGYDLNREDFNYEPIDLLKAGIVDPTSVIKEVVQNATSVVSQLVTLKASIYFKDREMKND
jgi:chaperonin GroEL